MKQANEYLRNLFLDYVNNYATIQLFSEHNGLYFDQAETLIDIGKALHEQYVDDLKSIEVFKRIRKIKQLVDNGVQVYSWNTGYVVHKDSIGQYLITFVSNGYTVGLCHKDESQLNGSDFFYFVDGNTRVNV